MVGLKNMKILHDNAGSHLHKNVNNFLNTERKAIIDHTHYSPLDLDLAPYDFLLFDYIKQRLTCQTDEKSLTKQITKILSLILIPKKEWLKTFQKWKERTKMCIKN